MHTKDIFTKEKLDASILLPWESSQISSWELRWLVIRLVVVGQIVSGWKMMMLTFQDWISHVRGDRWARVKTFFHFFDRWDTTNWVTAPWDEFLIKQEIRSLSQGLSGMPLGKQLLIVKERHYAKLESGATKVNMFYSAQHFDRITQAVLSASE